MPNAWNSRRAWRPPSLPGHQHLGARGPLGIGELPVLLHDERAAERDHQQHAEHAAHHRHRRHLADRQVVAQQQDGGKGEDDAGGDRFARRAGRLHDVVLEDGGLAQGPEEGDGEHGDRDRGGDREADLERQVDARGGEDDAQDRAERDRAEGQLGRRLARRDERVETRSLGSGWRRWSPCAPVGGRCQGYYDRRARAGRHAGRVRVVTAPTRPPASIWPLARTRSSDQSPGRPVCSGRSS